MWAWILVFVLFSPEVARSSQVVQTTTGPVEGYSKTIYNGEDVMTYLGIPYAKPPIGDLRFAPPQPVKPWKQTLQAKTLQTSCYQLATEQMKKFVWFVHDMPESEDCLYLNIWRPKKNTEKNLPIMIWIPPGGYLSGSASMPLYDGSILASEKNVIVASMNYRLGMFGFLYLNTTDVPGNAGLRDQILAFRWIKENAEVFGGDPNRITIFGESAGSISVNMHITNPKTYDLFQYAIMESGSIGMDIMSIPPTTALKNALLLARRKQCSVKDVKEVLKCLRSKSPVDILDGMLEIPSSLIIPFVPTRNGIEVAFDVHSSAERVLPRNRKNLMAGTIPNDAWAFLALYFPQKYFDDTFTVIENDINTLIKEHYGLKDEKLQDRMKDKYRISENSSQLRIEAGNMINDDMFFCPQTQFVKDWKTENNEVYYYSFNHLPSKPIRYPNPKWVGVTHGDEIPFVFGKPLDPNNGYTEEERSISRKIMSLWTTFAKTGNPNGRSSNLWPGLTSKGDFTYLDINQNFTVKTWEKKEECDFWRNTYPELLKEQEKLDAAKSP